MQALEMMLKLQRRGAASSTALLGLALAVGAPACGDSSGASSGSDGSPTGGGSTASTTAGPATAGSATQNMSAGTGTGTGAGTTSASTSTSSGSGSTTVIYDVAPGDDMAGVDSDDTTDPEPTCEVVDDLDAIGECGDEAPADSFNPEVQWTWGGNNTSVSVTPLVANLTDDNNDGEINLCDTPDVVVVAGALGGQIYVLDGATGQEHFSISGQIAYSFTPAIGDIDGDSAPEIVTVTTKPHKIVAYEENGDLKWVGDGTFDAAQGGAVAIADLDNDGSPEILADGMVSDADGNMLWQAPEQVGWKLLQKNTVPIAADLDNDADLEVILGQTAYQHDGTEIWNHPEVLPGYAQVANLDNDDDPEIIVNNSNGITILEHDGTIKYLDARPNGDPVGPIGNNWFRPSTVHDFDGDEVSDFAVSSAAHYTAFKASLAPKWIVDVDDGSGWATGTAFDFLGDGVAEAMYADEQHLFVYDGETGEVLLQVPRSSSTLIEYPVVADVDNDGSSEIVVVSNTPFEGDQTSPAVQVIRDAEDRWIQARRIWNQHSYHVTNVREDGSIPTYELPSWQNLNTYRTNAQIENGAVCKPMPPV